AVVAALRLGHRSQNAPGAAELKALGCGVAMISSLGDLAALSETRSPGSKSASAGVADRELTVVNCYNAVSEGPSWEDVARRYVQTTNPTRPFAVIRTRGALAGIGGRSTSNDCGVFSSSGDYLGPMDGKTLGRIAREGG